MTKPPPLYPPSFTAKQVALKLPEEIRERVFGFVRNQPASRRRDVLEAPFERQIDFWFTAIAWAVHNNLEPAEAATGKKFVSLGPTDADIRSFDSWRAELLIALAVRQFGAQSSDAYDVGKVVDLANRYAEVGARKLINDLDQVTDLSEPILYTTIEFFAEELASRPEAS